MLFLFLLLKHFLKIKCLLVNHLDIVPQLSLFLLILLYLFIIVHSHCIHKLFVHRLLTHIFFFINFRITCIELSAVLLKLVYLFVLSFWLCSKLVSPSCCLSLYSISFFSKLPNCCFILFLSIKQLRVLSFYLLIWFAYLDILTF